MTGRSFRERYAGLSGEAAACRQETPVADWSPQPGGRFIQTRDGPLSVYQHVYSGAEIVDARRSFERSLAARHPYAIDPAGIVFLDTETTGLAGGTGTWVFLVGLGRFSGDDFVVRQLFMRHPGDERALLCFLESELVHAETLMTYNGRAFDLPLIVTRLRMHGRDLTATAEHLDLLSAARAIWKHRLASCALSEIEREVLGVRRVADAPGWMIPQLYFGYLRTRRVEELESVFEHNRADIVSLARLAALVHAWEAGLDAPEHVIDALAVSLHRLRKFASEEAIDDLRRLWHQSIAPADLRLRALRELSTLLKRRRRYPEALDEWQRALRDPSRTIRQFAAEELAKYLEHQARDHAAALALARSAADGATLARDEQALAAFRRRTARLERKLQQAGGYDGA